MRRARSGRDHRRRHGRCAPIDFKGTSGDGRTSRARRFREVLTGYLAALAREPDIVELNLLRSAAALQLTIDDFEAETIGGDRTHYADWRGSLSQRDKMLRRVGILAGAGHYPAITTAGASDEDDDE